MPRQSGLPQQLARGPTLFLSDRYNSDPAQYAVHRRIPWASTQYFGKSRGRGDNLGLGLVGVLRQRHSQGVAGGELDEALGVQDQRPAYSSSSSS